MATTFVVPVLPLFKRQTLAVTFCPRLMEPAGEPLHVPETMVSPFETMFGCVVKFSTTLAVQISSLALFRRSVQEGKKLFA